MSLDYYGSNYNLQNNLLAILHKIASDDVKNEKNFLSEMVRQIVLHDRFNMLGGRVWQLVPEKKVYRLVFQYGSVRKVPDNYEVGIDSDYKFRNLADTHTLISEENDPVLINTGIVQYSMAGAGNFIKVDGHKYFSFILSFNAPEITPEFYETLSVISNFASMKIYEYQQVNAQKMYEKDLYTASKIQRDLLPEHYMEFYDYKIFGACIQSGGDNNVGGDYFDYFLNDQTEEERLGVLVSDAASKGLPAAVQAAFVSGAVKMAQSFSPKISNLLSYLNRLMFDTFPFERPVSMFYCELCLSSNRLILYANAGHTSPIHYRPSTDSYQELPPTGGLLGILQNQKYVVENVRMLPGDVMCIFSDGITEATNDKGEQFGKERMMEIMKEHCGKTTKEIAHLIIEAATIFASEDEYNDDKTIIVIKRDIEEENDEQ